MIDTSFNLLEYIYKKDFQNSFLSLSMLDYYFEYSYKKKYISHKCCNKYLNELIIIKKLLYGWKKYHECKSL